MFRRIDITKFGSFEDYNWRDAGAVGINSVFEKVNIIYGRNYSGKTTLSRIFRSFEEKKLPKHYADGRFVLHDEDRRITEADIGTANVDVRVYNRDFATQNLSFLHDEESGEVIPFATVGSRNNEITATIEALEAQLAGEDGIKTKLGSVRTRAREAEDRRDAANTNLENKLKKHANDVIKQDREIGRANYFVDSLKKDIQQVRSEQREAFDSEKEAALWAVIKEDVLPAIVAAQPPELLISNLQRKATEALTKQIRPSEALQELLSNDLLQAWVRDGIPLHRGKRSTCGFCNQPLSEDLWTKLDAHFSKESVELERELEEVIQQCRSELTKSPNTTIYRAMRFYGAQQMKVNPLVTSLELEWTKYKNEVQKIIDALNERRISIFKIGTPPLLSDNSETIREIFAHLRSLIEENNARSATLSTEKDSAREELRLNNVLSFINAIEYEDSLGKIADLAEEVKIAAAELPALVAEERRIAEAITAERAQLNDERAAAQLVNSYLNSHFGHHGLRMDANDAGPNTVVTFRIMRGQLPAYNLSEGECSLIAFCYFMAKLQDVETAGKDVTVYIDDPISSLDNNHVFFVYSLIESVIAAPVRTPNQPNSFRYRQLFISTHNLDFFKYLKSLSYPYDKAARLDRRAFFLVERLGERSNLVKMPTYLQEYQTEFIYLFHQIFRCQAELVGDRDYEVYYSFGNNLRKFLEAYLFYKYPYHGTKQEERLTLFFGGDASAVEVNTRISNELSHLAGIFERGMRPIDVPEIPRLAKYVLDTIWSKDQDQYNSLMKSIGQPERAP